MDDGEPAERDDAEEHLRGLTRRIGIEPQLRRHRREGLLAGRERRGNVHREIGTTEGRALDQAHELAMRVEKVEILPDGTGEDLLRGAAAGKGAIASRPHGSAHIVEAAVEHRPVELRLGAEEVAGGGAGHAGERPHVAQAGSVVAPLGKELLGGVEYGGAGARGIAFTVRCGQYFSLASRSAYISPDVPSCKGERL